MLLSPRLRASAVYYKQKLQIHNFTIYRCNDAEVDLYVWHEGNGGMGANEFVTCIANYLEGLPTDKKRVILISDGCGYQNRNKSLASMLSDMSQRRGIVIEQLILEKGHTMMEADSVHSVLEQMFRNQELYSPSDYIVLMRSARSELPYHVHSINFDFFKNYDSLPSNFSSIRPGKKAGDPVVTDIRAFLYKPSGEVLYKLRHPDDWTLLPCRRRVVNCTPPVLYTASIAISADKYKHLQELKVVIPPEYHEFYDQLKHQ